MPVDNKFYLKVYLFVNIICMESHFIPNICWTLDGFLNFVLIPLELIFSISVQSYTYICVIRKRGDLSNRLIFYKGNGFIFIALMLKNQLNK